ncbi:MAG: hypothetical protein ACT4OM_05140 [Actinomycetota bacterium]
MVDEPPIPKTVANKITDSEREVIIEAAGYLDNNSHLRHRKLAYTLSRRELCFVQPLHHPAGAPLGQPGVRLREAARPRRSASGDRCYRVQPDLRLLQTL